MLSVHILVQDQSPFPLVLGDGVVSLKGHAGEGLVRVWIGASEAKALLAGQLRLTLSALKVSGSQATVMLRGVRVVATPLSDDLRARLDQAGHE